MRKPDTGEKRVTSPLLSLHSAIQKRALATLTQLTRLIISATIVADKINMRRSMESFTLYTESLEIGNKLSLFGVDLKDLQAVALEAVSARNQASPLHPANAPGMYSYMAGVAALRMILLAKKDGWTMSRHKGVEAIENKDMGIMILFQNVDKACGQHDPNPISNKGEAVTQLVDNPAGYLWQYMEEEDKKAENQHVWFFCVSSNGEDVRAELSRPKAIKNGRFGSFAERIFIIQDSDENLLDLGNDNGPVEEDDFEVTVTKKS